ncbi:glycosyltransferase family 4 protein [Edwardsiella tarda]|uniref:glycosyltransferase family 4 protein n=1 Tax=Edwardsiella tarda TaxID=636 RepID=UPI003F65568E
MKVIFFGPKKKPITGQSVSFHNLVNSYNESKFYTICYGGNSVISRVLSTMFSSLKLFLLCSTNKINKIYITTSRTKIGFVRDFIALNICHLFSCKIINHLHGADFKIFYSSLSQRERCLVDYVYNKIDCSIVLSPNMREQYSMYPKMKIVSIHNGASFPKRNPIFLNKKKNRVLYLSNIMYSKGITFLISAINDLNRDGFDFELIIAGEILSDDYRSIDQMRECFFSLISKNKNIKYVGVVSGDEKESLLHDSMFFVLPSFYKTEAQPISIIEAMQNGCIIITTKHNYIPDYISDNNGKLVPIESSDEIKNAILSIWGDEDKLLSIYKRNIDYARSDFSLDKNIQSIKSLLTK